MEVTANILDTCQCRKKRKKRTMRLTSNSGRSINLRVKRMLFENDTSKGMEEFFFFHPWVIHYGGWMIIPVLTHRKTVMKAAYLACLVGAPGTGWPPKRR